MKTFPALVARLACCMAGLASAAPAAVLAAMPCAAPQPPAHHPAVAALGRAYFEAVPQWQSLTAGQRDLLVRVSLLQRDKRIADARLTFQDSPPADIVPVPGEGVDARMRAGAAQALGRLLAEGRGAGKAAAPGFRLHLGDTLRAYADQKENWSVNLKRYLLEMEKEGRLAGYRLAGGRYADPAVCRLRAYAAVRYAFPGFSNHQQGLAVDFHAQDAGGSRLVASTAAKTVGATGLTNIQLWCRSRAFAWLAANARRHGFVQAGGIDEPWHWEWRPALAADARRAAYVSPSCRR